MGKTTFILQSLFNAAKNGENCVFVSLLSEPKEMIDRFMSGYSFYDPELYENGKIKFIPLTESILKEGDLAVFQFINEEIKKLKPDRLAIDPFTILSYTVKSFEARELEEPEKRGFLLELFNQMKSWNSFVLLSGELPQGTIENSSWSFLVDGVIHLGEEKINQNRLRYLEVRKMRGTAYQPGIHYMKIKENGLNIYPRFSYHPESRETPEGIVKTGNEDLDKMLGGGFPRGSATMLTGNAGTGRSLVGLRFILEGASHGEPGIVVSFEKDPATHYRAAKSMGWSLTQLEEDGLVKMIYTPPCTIYPDELAHFLHEKIEETGCKRVLVDSASGIRQCIQNPINFRQYILSLINLFKDYGVTSIFLDESTIVTSPQPATMDLSYIMDTIIYLRHVEIESEIRKSILILKMQGSKYDREIREYTISEGGLLEIKEAFKGQENITSGTARRAVKEHRKKILIADDSPQTIKLVKYSLAREPFEVIEATSGKEAVKKVLLDAPDLILLDIMMPDMDGYQVVEKLKERKTTAKIPIIMLTAKAETESKITAMKLGVDDYITKPFDPRELVARIKMIIRDE